MEPIDLPVEAVVVGTPPSLQGSRKAKQDWKKKVGEAFRRAVPENAWLVDHPVTVTVYVFSEGPLSGDLDNRLKHTIDGLKGSVVTDDALVHRIVAQKFDGEAVIGLPRSATPTLLGALSGARPFVYVKVAEELYGE